MPIFLASLLIFLTPFIINPFFGYFYEPPKVIFAEILIELLLFTSLFKGGFFKSLDKHQLILCGLLVVLTLIHIPKVEAFFGNEFRLQGIFLLWHLLILSLISSRLKVAELAGILFPVSLAFLFLTALVGAPDINGRAVGTLGEANALASSAIFFFPLALFYKFKSWDKILKLGIVLTTLSVVLLSGSRSGMLAFPVQLIFLISFKWLGVFKAAILTFLIISSLLILPFLEGGGWYENRAEIWQTAFFAGQQSFLGAGFGNIEQALNNASIKLGNNIKYQSVDSAHNFLLDFYVQGGLIAVAVVILLIILSLEGFVKGKRAVEITALLGLICVLAFNPTSVATLVAFWFILGQGFKGQIKGV